MLINTLIHLLISSGGGKDVSIGTLDICSDVACLEIGIRGRHTLENLENDFNPLYLEDTINAEG